MKAGVRTIKGRPVVSTGWDARGRAHIRHPLRWDETLCGRVLDQAGIPTGKSCGACAEDAAWANLQLRLLLG